MIDLHIHSTASDGSFTPPQIVNLAVSKGLNAIAITDHDTIDGVREAIEAGIPHNLEFITGVELSAQPLPGYGKDGSIHILGYGFSIYDRQITRTLEKLGDARANRNPLILERLRNLGFTLTMDEVIAISGPGQIGRPHIAKAMVEKGYVASFDEAFDHYLGKGRPAYIDKFRLSCVAAIKMIIDAGGVPVLAHPGLIKIDNSYQHEFSGDCHSKSGQEADLSPVSACYQNKCNPIEYFISQLVGMGLMGIEVFHTDHSEEQTKYFAKLAQKKRLLMTGGSDFHGTMKPEVKMGSGIGNLSISNDHYKNLSIAAERTRKESNQISKLEDNLCYSFNDRALLMTALCHSSYINEVPSLDITDNQRFEFLGDAVLGLAVAHLLMQKFPNMKEGELSKLRSTLVSEASLSSMARLMDIGRFISLGKGERLTRGSEKNSILADTFEAIIAAIYLEIGFKETCELISIYFDAQMNQITSGNDTCDYKSMLQEMVQEMGNFIPCYKILRETGPDHNKTFEILLNVCDIEAKGEGKNKKSAEQNAAANAMAILKKQKELSC
ncbi:MAG: ribonuclease III [Desulfamplus sp.]|nr:ribonuclease III [Desulfamplus sp.]